jgi:hypothetical protein
VPRARPGYLHGVTSGAATLWTAVAAGGGALVASAITALVTYRITTRQVSSQTQLAREARQQERLLNAYVTLTEYAVAWARSTEWRLQQLMSPADSEGSEPTPGNMDPAAEAYALLVISDVVGEALRTLNRKVTDFRRDLDPFVECSLAEG